MWRASPIARCKDASAPGVPHGTLIISSAELSAYPAMAPSKSKGPRTPLKQGASPRPHNVTAHQGSPLLTAMSELVMVHPDCQVMMVWPGTVGMPDFTPWRSIGNDFNGGQQVFIGTVPRSVYQPSIHDIFGHVYDPSGIAYASRPRAGQATGSSIAQQYRKFDNIVDSESEDEGARVLESISDEEEMPGLVSEEEEEGAEEEGRDTQEFEDEGAHVGSGARGYCNSGGPQTPGTPPGKCSLPFLNN